MLVSIFNYNGDSTEFNVASYTFPIGYTPPDGSRSLLMVTRDTTASIDALSGWTEYSNVVHDSARTKIYTRDHGVSEATSITITGQGAAQFCVGILTLDSYNSDLNTMINDFIFNVKSDTNHETPVLTTTLPNCLIWSGCGVNSVPTLASDVNLDTELWNENSTTLANDGCSSISGVEQFTGMGATPVRTYTASPADFAMTFAMAIAPVDSTDVIMDANPSTLNLTGSSVTFTAPSNAEPANATFNGETWLNETWGNPSTWWPLTDSIIMQANSSTLSLVPSSVTFTSTTGNTILDATSSTLSLTGSEAFLGDPQNIIMDANSNTLSLTGGTVGFNIAFPAVYREPRLNVSEYGDILRVDFGEDIAQNEKLIFILEPKQGNGKEKVDGVTVGNANVTVGDKKYKAGQYIEYTIEPEDLDYAGQWRMKGEAIMSDTKKIVTDYQLFTVFE